MTAMHSCPSCAAPLDDEGICTSCGALARGFFRDLDLGAPQIAEAVANGLDFYRLLGVAPEDDLRAVARRYRQLRVLFPDDPSDLAEVPARRLALLEQAGRVLTDPRLRRSYDELRAGAGARVSNAVLRCIGCAAPLPPEAARCSFCGTARPARPQAPAGPPAGPPPAEPVDYYAVLGLTATHLLPTPPTPALRGAVAFSAAGRLGLAGAQASLASGEPPRAEDIDVAALTRERQILLAQGYSPEQREERVAELEIARRILRDERRRSSYDMLLLGFRQGLLGNARLDALRQLQDLARADMAEQRGEQASGAEAAALLRQGLGYLDARLPREALEPLRRAAGALPQLAEAQAGYLRAILASDDPLALGGHLLRQALGCLEALDRLAEADAPRAALGALCQGLLAREQGDPIAAAAQLQRAANLDSGLAPAWRGLAALALARNAPAEALDYCRRALASDARDERALLMAIGACLRSRRRDEAHALAAQVAALRGDAWTAAAVLRELGG